MKLKNSRLAATLLFVLTLSGLSACKSAPLARKLADVPEEPIAWVELGASSNVIARAITGDSECPRLQLNADATELPMTLRVPPSDAFPVRICEAEIPYGTWSARLGEQQLPLPAGDPHKILFIGDTGCRINTRPDGKQELQACNDPHGWPFPVMAASEANGNPDLVIHLGDYLYREVPCPAGNTQCAGSPSGNNWESWNADFFAAAKPLLRKAPWIFVRGNHELCKRAGEGWFRFFDPTPYHACTDDTAPYLVRQGRAEFVVLDSALATDPKAPSDQVQLYKRQFDAIGQMPIHHAWLLTHKPIWSPALRDSKDPKSPIVYINQTLQGASGNHLPPTIDSVFAGHLHLFEELHFADGRPSQIVVGNGGTSLSLIAAKTPVGLKFAGTSVSEGLSVSDFGYFTLEDRDGKAWEGTVYDSEGLPMLSCPEKDHSIHCKPVNARR